MKTGRKEINRLLGKGEDAEAKNVKKKIVNLCMNKDAVEEVVVKEGEREMDLERDRADEEVLAEIKFLVIKKC
ncbi:MAG: hypothetical protein B6D44_06300 [Ignavibacteriales bacterium UTCHB2]|jgi:hypothetical protein|nr:MAG: hypothetical protein B6D44_06300 [Ignavibacteriales bacterium UTCHB2]